MSTPWPKDPLLLPPHQALPLTAADRLALEEVVWEEIGTTLSGVRGLEGTSPEGYWGIWTNGEEIDQGYAVHFCPDVSEEREEELKALYPGEAGTVEYSLWRGYTSDTELGYTLTVELAKQWVEQMRRAEAGLDRDAALSEAGFVKAQPGHLDAGYSSYHRYEKPFGRGEFTLYIRPYGYHLIFREHNHPAHDTICRVRLAQCSYKNEAIPVVWPEVVAVPSEVGLQVALAAMAEYERLYEPGREPGKRRPSRSRRRS